MISKSWRWCHHFSCLPTNRFIYDCSQSQVLLNILRCFYYAKLLYSRLFKFIYCSISRRNPKAVKQKSRLILIFSGIISIYNVEIARSFFSANNFLNWLLVLSTSSLHLKSNLNSALQCWQVAFFAHRRFLLSIHVIIIFVSD